jgi:hypothetical protein
MMFKSIIYFFKNLFKRADCDHEWECIGQNYDFSVHLDCKNVINMLTRNLEKEFSWNRFGGLKNEFRQIRG